MAHSTSFSDVKEVKEAEDSRCDSPDTSGFPQTLVTEKVIFVIDILLLASEKGSTLNIVTILLLFKQYFNLKRKVCIKPPEFECLLYNNNTVHPSSINSVKDLKSAFISIQEIECEEENQPLKIDKVFDGIANLVELPDPDCLKKCLPPNWVYHVIWLIGRNLYIPKMENTNSFDYLMMTPYFALDMLYVYNKNIELNQCEQISQALSKLNENGKGYFLSTSSVSTGELFSCVAQFLGHPLIRVPQAKARYNILELGRHLEVAENNNEEE